MLKDSDESVLKKTKKKIKQNNIQRIERPIYKNNNDGNENLNILLQATIK